MIYKCFASGSTGNFSMLISNSGRILLLECGIAEQQIKLAIEDWSLIDGCVLTHSHKDHSISLDFMQQRYISCYGTHTNKVGDTIAVGEWKIMCCPATHNIECLSYLIYNTYEKKTIYFASDTSEFANIAKKQYNLLLIEVNHDWKTLQELYAIEAITNDGYKNHMPLTSPNEYTTSAVSWLAEYPKQKTIVAHHLSKQHANKDLILSELKPFANKVFIAEKNLEIEI